MYGFRWCNKFVRYELRGLVSAIKLGRFGGGARVSLSLSLVLLAQVFTFSIAYGDVMFDEKLCGSRVPVDLGMRGKVLGSFYFDKECLFNEGGRDALKSEISLRLNYKKNPDEALVVYNDIASNSSFLYINVRPTLNPDFIENKIQILLRENFVEKNGRELIYDAGKYSAHSFNIINEGDYSYYVWCVSGGACGRVALLNESLIYEVVMPEHELGSLADISVLAKKYLIENLK
jgi:hypothetical protein